MNMKRVAMLLLCGMMAMAMTACQTATGSGLSVEAAGVCSQYVTAGGQEVKVCYHPVTRLVTLSGTYQGRRYLLTADKSGRAEGTLPDGTVIVYDPAAEEKLSFTGPPVVAAAK